MNCAYCDKDLSEEDHTRIDSILVVAIGKFMPDGSLRLLKPGDRVCDQCWYGGPKHSN